MAGSGWGGRTAALNEERKYSFNLGWVTFKWLHSSGREFRGLRLGGVCSVESADDESRKGWGGGRNDLKIGLIQTKVGACAAKRLKKAKETWF